LIVFDKLDTTTLKFQKFYITPIIGLAPGDFERALIYHHSKTHYVFLGAVFNINSTDKSQYYIWTNLAIFKVKIYFYF
jgi:hypothetical protein